MSEQHEATPSVWGPAGRRAAVSVTFDNLGEAADLERGLWPEDEPLGRHFSVRRSLPRILNVLDEFGLRATFFVEGLNAELYPEALLEITERGHDLGYHGWRHEYWAGLSPSEEARLLERGVSAMGNVGVRPRGFRPPGGRLNPASLSLLESLGFSYCSPAGRGVGVREGMVILAFDWRSVDAYYYLPRFGDLRKADTGSGEPLAPSRFGETIEARLESTVRDGGHVSLVLHPFLEEQDDRFEVLREALETLSVLAEDRIWCAPYQDVASWVRSHPREFSDELYLDLTET
jgi:peptidoglycan/xylan/chitin deacetylase (PgdA/CDA1 family)